MLFTLGPSNALYVRYIAEYGKVRGFYVDSSTQNALIQAPVIVLKDYSSEEEYYKKLEEHQRNLQITQKEANEKLQLARDTS